MLHLLIGLADRDDTRQTWDEVTRELGRYYDDIRNPRNKECFAQRNGYLNWGEREWAATTADPIFP